MTDEEFEEFYQWICKTKHVAKKGWKPCKATTELLLEYQSYMRIRNRRK